MALRIVGSTFCSPGNIPTLYVAVYSIIHVRQSFCRDKGIKSLCGYPLRTGCSMKQLAYAGNILQTAAVVWETSAGQSKH